MATPNPFTFPFAIATPPPSTKLATLAPPPAPKLTPEQKAQEKADTKTEKQIASQLSLAQEASREILKSELLSSGVPKAEVNRILDAEKKQDNAELRAYEVAAKTPGLQEYGGYQQRTLTAEQILAASPGAQGRGLTADDVQRYIDTGQVQAPSVSTGYIVPKFTTVNPQYADAVDRAMKRQMAGIELLQGVQAQQAFKSGKTTVGTNTFRADLLTRGFDQETGQYIVTDEMRKATGSRGASQLVQAINEFQRFSNDSSITAADFTRDLNPVKGADGVFTSALTTNKKGGSTGTFVLNQDGTYDFLGGYQTFTPTDGGGLGSFLKSVAISAGLGAIGSFFGVPSLGSLLGLSGNAATAFNAAVVLGSGGLSAYRTNMEYDAAVARGEVAGLDTLFTGVFKDYDAAAKVGGDVVKAGGQEMRVESDKQMADLRAQLEAQQAEFARLVAAQQAEFARQAAAQQRVQQQFSGQQNADLQRARAAQQERAESLRRELEGSQRDIAARRAARRRAAGRGGGGLIGAATLPSTSLNVSPSSTLGMANASTLGVA
jgi:hypothetical protein